MELGANEDEKLKDFERTIQDVDRVLLHLEYALSKNVRRNHVFEIIGEASPSMWRRWFDVHQFEVITLLNEWPGKSTTMLIERCWETLLMNLSRWCTERLSSSLMIKYFEKEFCLVRLTKESCPLFVFAAMSVELRQQIMAEIATRRSRALYALPPCSTASVSRLCLSSTV